MSLPGRAEGEVRLAQPDGSPVRGPAASPRHAGFDALKGALTLLVVLHHTAITYGAIGGWYYQELPPDGSLSSTLLVFFCTFNQAWFMGLFFLLAGYHTVPALALGGARHFMAKRVLRLGLPLLVYGCLIGPATMALAGLAQGQPFWPGLLRLWRNLTFEPGPLWFAEALLVFAAMAALLWTASPVVRRWGEQPRRPTPWPSRRCLLWAALATGLGAAALRVSWPVGSTVWGLQPGYFASYTVLFTFGCIAWRQRWLEHTPEDEVRWWRRLLRWVLPVLPAVYLLGGLWPVLRDAPLRITHAFWEPLVAWGMAMALLQRFRRPDGQAWRPWAKLGERAFAIYVLHPPVVVGLALAWRTVDAPALLKFAATGLLACAVCHGLAGALLRLRLPLLRWPQVRRLF